MPLVSTLGLTVGEMAERLALCTGETSAFHGRQLRHWAQAGVLDALGPWHTRGQGVTAARVFTTRHLGGALLLHHFANQRADIEFLGTVARLMRNDSVAHDDARVWEDLGGAISKRATDGLAIALQFAQKIARGEKPKDWQIFLSLHLTRDGEAGAGSFTTNVHASPFSALWVEQRILDASALLPCIFRDADHQLNQLGRADLSQSGEAFEIVESAEA